MDFRNCLDCGKLFMDSKKQLCSECIKKDTEDFEKVRRYLRENPKEKLGDVSEATEVTIKKINRYIQEGKLSVTEGLSDNYKCTICGTNVIKGKFCDKCAKKLSTRANNVLSKNLTEENRNKIKMHHIKNK